MFKKTLIVTVAVLSMTGASLAPTSSAQAGVLGKFIAADIVGAVVGSALTSHPSHAEGDREIYRPVERCGFVLRPVFDAYGNRAGMQRISAC